MDIAGGVGGWVIVITPVIGSFVTTGLGISGGRVVVLDPSKISALVQF